MGARIERARGDCRLEVRHRFAQLVTLQPGATQGGADTRQLGVHLRRLERRAEHAGFAAGRDADVGGDGLGDLSGVAGDHHDPLHAEGTEVLDGLAGLRSDLVLEGEHADVFLPADVHGADLVEVVDGLLALSGADAEA